MGWKEAGKTRGFPVLLMGKIEDIFQMEGKEGKDQERLKIRRRKSMQDRGRYFGMGSATLSGPVTVDKERFVAAAKKFSGKEGKKKNK